MDTNHNQESECDSEFTGIKKALAGLNIRRDEKDYQDEISAKLDAHRLSHQREVMCVGGIVDFVISEKIAMEVKTAGQLKKARAQLIEYMKDPRFTMGILMTSRPWNLGKEIVNGKPIYGIRMCWEGL